MQFYEIHICQIMIFRLYTVYNKHQMVNIGNQTKEKSQVLLSARIILLLIVTRTQSDVEDTGFFNVLQASRRSMKQVILQMRRCTSSKEKEFQNRTKKNLHTHIMIFMDMDNNVINCDFAISPLSDCWKSCIKFIFFDYSYFSRLYKYVIYLISY